MMIKLLKMIALPIWVITITARPDQKIEENTNPNFQYTTPTDIEKSQPMYNELIPIESRNKRSTSEVDDKGDIFCLKNEDMYCHNPSNIEWEQQHSTIHKAKYKDLAKRTPEELKWAKEIAAEIQKIKNNETKPYHSYPKEIRR